MNREEYRKIRLSVETKLSNIEGYVNDIDILKGSIEEIKNNGGKITIHTFTSNESKNCKIIISTDLAEKCLSIILDEFVSDVKKIREEIICCLDNVIKDAYKITSTLPSKDIDVGIEKVHKK